jgi:hypothetical protein
MSRTWRLLVLIVAAVAISARAAAREATCSQPLVPEEPKVPSFATTDPPCGSEVANECSLDGPGVLSGIRWWGGDLESVPGSPDVTRFNIRIYDDVDCHPGSLLVELLDVEPGFVLVGHDSLGYPNFEYVAEVSIPVSGGTFWCGIQGQLTDPLPPQWGRGGDAGKLARPQPCTSVFIAPCQGYDAWTPVVELVGRPWEASQEFLFEPGPTPVSPASWGRLKALAR